MKRALNVLAWGTLSSLLLQGTAVANSGSAVAEHPTRTAPAATDYQNVQSVEPALGAAFAAEYPATELATDISRSHLETLELYGPWLSANGISDNARQLILHLEDARAHGLNPDSYGLSRLHETIDQLAMGLYAPRAVGSPQEQRDLRADLAKGLDRAFTDLARDLGQGVVNARNIQRNLFRDPPTVNTERLLEAMVKGDMDTNAALLSVTPNHIGYTRLVSRMRDLLTEKAAGAARTVISSRETMKLGDENPGVQQVKHRLIETGELGYFARLDSSFDDELEKAVKHFQLRHGLPDDGVVDERTRDWLNLTADQEIEQLAMSLERWRWMPREMGNLHIMVNVPNYKVEMFNGHQKILDMIAVVGAKKHQTPNFSRDMAYIEFNPTWTVPASIANNELVPIERRNPGYLVSRNFMFLRHTSRGLREVPASQVSRADFRRRPFPYVLRQRGGANNALGRMKFMMPNPYAIYLHDTQAQKYFGYNDRAFSHGCIRLSDPDYFARLVMSLDGRSEDEIVSALSDPETHRVRLRNTIPTHLTYMTSWVDDAGQLQHRDDVYKHDPALLHSLQTSNTLLSVLDQLGISTEPEETQEENLEALVASN